MDFSMAPVSPPDDGQRNLEAAGVAALLEANGYTEEDLSRSSAPILELEMFLQDYPKMVGLQQFQSLVTLRLIQQGIEKIEGLEHSTCLQKLWLIENKIEAVEGLCTCTRLQELYLYSNRITTITGLQQLTGLQVLWLADNYISSLDGLSHLCRLRELNLARNDITLIGDSLVLNTALTSVNLADNHISSFQDVACLAKLPCLQELCLADPFWGECPVAGLCNYQTFVLYLLPKLTSLDTSLLAEETKAAAAATFTKKQLYYNMRIHTLRRAAADLIRQAHAGCKVYNSAWLQVYQELACAAKGLQRQAHLALPTAPSQKQLAHVQSCLQAVLEHKAALASKLAADSHTAMSLLESAVRKLQLELSSGGNIRLEEALPNDSCSAACLQLLQSRFVAAGEPGGTDGLADIQVLSVARIHNRHVRLQFEKYVAATGADTGCGTSKQQCMDYLLFGEHPSLPGELMHVVQHGFRSCAEYGARGLDEAIRLANCVNMADQQCMHVVEAQAAAQSEDSTSSYKSRLMQAELLVCKVCLPAAAKELPGHVQLPLTGNKKFRGRDGQLQVSACLDGARVLASQHPNTAAVYRTASTCRQVAKTGGEQLLLQHRMWYIFDQAAVLPEYLVTVQYSSQPLPGLHMAHQAATIRQSDPLLGLCAQSLQAWLTPAAGDGLEGFINQQLQDDCKGAVAGAAAATMQVQLGAITPETLAPVAGGQQLSTLHFLSLHNCALSNCSGLLHMVPCLSELVLSFNNFTTLDSLFEAASSTTTHCCSNLKVLDVSFNNISILQPQWLAAMPQLLALDASYNQLTQLQTLSQLARHTPLLQTLNLSGNAVQHHKAYQLTARSSLTKLQQLDGQPLSAAAGSDGTLSAAVMHCGATLWHSNAGPVAEPSTRGSGAWQLQLHSVVLEHRALQSLAGIAAARCIVCLNLAHNLLTTVAGLEGCSRLQELNLSNNLLTEVQQLSKIVSLQQLDVSQNQLSSLLPLSSLTGISQLNVESNQLTRFTGVTALSGLLELYAANNFVEDIKEAERLSVLPRLVILDLAGNPLVVNSDYRLLLLYRLRHLKVLDGLPADASELTAARAKYSGRLTMSFLEEQLGSSCSMSAIRSLDVSGLRIRDVGHVFGPGCPFAALSELVLDNNNIISLAPLAGLAGLSVLKISGNRLGLGEAEATGLTFALPAAGASQPGSLLSNLQILHMANNGLTSLVPLQLQCLPAMRCLFVQENELQQLDGLQGLHQLQQLVANKNKIRVLDAEVLSSVVRLSELHLQDNLIRSLACGSSSCVSTGSPSITRFGSYLPSLLALHLDGNRLSEMADLDKLSTLSGLLEISLGGNPITRRQVHKPWLVARCPVIQVIDHQPITDEDRAYAAAVLGPSPAECAAAVDPASGLLAAAAAAAAADNRAGMSFITARPAPAPASTMPAVLNYDAFSQLTGGATMHAAGLGITHQLVTSVPSIQSGVLVLSGPAAFGLEGTAISGSRIVASGGSAATGSLRQRPTSGKRSPWPSTYASSAAGAAATVNKMMMTPVLPHGSGGRRTTGLP